MYNNPLTLGVCFFAGNTAELLIHPSLEGRPILIIANKTDDCESISTDLARTIKNWFAEKLAHIDEDPEKSSLPPERQTDNVFADNEEESYRPPPASARSTLNNREYEWDVLLASAIEG